METMSVSPDQTSLASLPIHRETPESAQASKHQAVLVLGMHRSGTSLLARILNLLGVDLGSDLMPSSPANEKGFWEHRQAVTLHGEVYNLFGHDWNSVAPLPPRWWEDPRVGPFHASLRELLEHDFSASRLWGMKDPRLCEMLPLWQAVLDEIGVQPRYVLTFRNPVEVAESLKKYHGMPASRAYILWLQSLLSAEKYSRGSARAIVSYESLLEDWQSQVLNITRELQIDWPNSLESVSPAIAEFVQPQLRHYAVDDKAFLDNAEVPELVRRAYRAALEVLTTRDPAGLANIFDQIRHELDEISPMLTKFMADADVDFRRSAQTSHELATTHVELAKLQERLTTETAEKAAIQQQLTDAADARQQLSRSLTDAEELRKELVEKFTEAIRERDQQIDRLYQDMGRRIDQRRLRMQQSREKNALRDEKDNPVKEQTKRTVVVIIPFYNGSAFIERALKSIFEQTVPADEVIVVNDGSREDERATLGELATKYPFKILDKENGGQGSARNAGVAASTSDYICFLDQDDFYLSNHIEVLVKAIPDDDPRFGWVYADLAEANGDGNVVRTTMIKEHAVHPKRTVIDLLGSDMFVLPSASLISRRAYLAVDGFDPQFVGYEDDDLFMRLFRKGYTNHFVDRPVTVWCIHVNSASYSIKMARSRLRYFNKLVNLFPDEPEKARFYFRDCLMRRFGPMFFVDALNAAKRSDPNRPEIAQNLREYAKVVCANPSVSWKYKPRIRLAVYLLSVGSPGFVKAMESASRLPILRRMNWCL